MSLLYFFKRYELASLIVLLLVIVIPFMFINIRSYYTLTHNNTTPPQPTPTTIPVTNIPTVFNRVTPSSGTQTSEQRMLDLIQHRRPLSQEDGNAKNAILAMLPDGEHSGVLYKTQSFSIEYVHSADVFQVELFSDEVTVNKRHAIQWFEQHGISHAGVCHLPVVFYLEFQLSTQFRQQQKAFDPLPEGC